MLVTEYNNYICIEPQRDHNFLTIVKIKWFCFTIFVED